MREQPTLADYWMALYNRRGIILAVALSAMFFAIGITRYLPPVYEAKASFFVPINLIPTSYAVAAGPSQLPLRPQPDDREAGIHVGILRSNDLAERIQARFPQKEPGFFRKNVNFVTSPQFFTDIYVRDSDPKLAADIANAYVQVYREFHIDTLRASASRAQKALEGKVRDLQARVAAKSAELRTYQEANRLVSGTSGERLYLRQREDLERQRDENALLIAAARQRLQAATSPARQIDGRDEPVISNPVAEQLQTLENRQAALLARLDELAKTTRSTIAGTTTVQMLETDKRNLEQQLITAESNLSETRLQAEFPNVEIVQVQVARAPTVPGFPIVTLNAVVALIVGFAAGCYCALLLEYLQRLKIERIRRNLDAGVLQEAFK